MTYRSEHFNELFETLRVLTHIFEFRVSTGAALHEMCGYRHGFLGSPGDRRPSPRVKPLATMARVNAREWCRQLRVAKGTQIQEMYRSVERFHLRNVAPVRRPFGEVPDDSGFVKKGLVNVGVDSFGREPKFALFLEVFDLMKKATFGSETLATVNRIERYGPSQ